MTHQPPYSFRRQPGPHDSGAWSILDAAGVACGVLHMVDRLRFEDLAFDRIRRGMNGPAPKGVAPRTWRWARSESSTPRWVFLHNGRPSFELGLDRHDRHLVDAMAFRIVDALNEDRGPADPFPEPLQPERFKPWEIDDPERVR